MALEPTPDPLDRAARAARREVDEGWPETSASIMARVRSVVTMAEPVRVFTGYDPTSGGTDDSRTFLSTRVVTASLRRLLRGPTHVMGALDLTVEDHRLLAVAVSLICSYGIDLVGLADGVRADVAAELVALLGADPDFGPADITVVIADVVVGDPNLV